LPNSAVFIPVIHDQPQGHDLIQGCAFSWLSKQFKNNNTISVIARLAISWGMLFYIRYKDDSLSDNLMKFHTKHILIRKTKCTESSNTISQAIQAKVQLLQIEKQFLLLTFHFIFILPPKEGCLSA